MALLSISNDKLPETLVLNCAISDLACFAWLQSHSNPSPGASPKHSRQHILQEHLSDKFIWASTSVLLSEHTNLAQMSASVFTVSLVGKQWWSTLGRPDLLWFFSIRAKNNSLFVYFFLYKCTNYDEYAQSSAKKWATPYIHCIKHDLFPRSHKS